MRQPLLWLVELGLTSVTIELNCLPVVHGVKEGLHNNSEFGAIISSCANFLSNYQSFEVSYVRRQANLAIHTIMTASRLHVRSMLFNLFPTYIETLFIMKCIEFVLVKKINFNQVYSSKEIKEQVH